MELPLAKGFRLRSAWVAVAIVVSILGAASHSRAGDGSGGWLREWTNGAHPWSGSSTPFVDFSRSPGWLNGLSVSGFAEVTSGMWVNSSGLTDFGKSAGEHHGANSLAIQRQLLQLDANYELNSGNSWFLRFWAVYEPPYPWEAHNIAGPNLVYDKSQSDFYNRYDIRDAYWRNTTGPITVFLGRQVVTWGESLAFRVGDVINPQDLSWNFGFANLEQSRLPLWMLHPIVSLHEFGPLSSNFIEGVWAPAWQPLYTGTSYTDHRYAGQSAVAGSVNLLPPSGARFDSYPYPFTTAAQATHGQQAAFPQIKNFTAPFQTWALPTTAWANSAGGARLHTIAENTEITSLFWHGHQLNPTNFVEGTPHTGQSLQMRFPQVDDVGVTINRPIYLTGSLAAELPLVFRGEAVWQDRTPFNTVSTIHPSGVTYSSTLNTLMALDMDNVAVPSLTSTGTLTTNLEWNNYTILRPNSTMVYGGYAERWRHNEENLLLSATTSWWWGTIVPTVTAIYNPDGNTWELFPNIVLTPPWTNRYFVNLQYIGVLGNDKFSAYAGGNFKGKNILLMRFQYNLELVRGRD